MWEDALIRFLGILAGFAIGTVSGVLLSAVLYAVRPIRHLVDPIIELSHPLPPLAFIRVLIVWFGTDDPKIVVIAVGVLPVIVVSTVSELRNVADELELGVHVGGAPAYARWHVQVRAAMPAIVSRMRVSRREHGGASPPR